MKMLGRWAGKDKAKVKVTGSFQLVKFDGDAPVVGELKEPAEIIEGGDDKKTEVVYRKGEGVNKQLFTGDGTGHAILKEVVKR